MREGAGKDGPEIEKKRDEKGLKKVTADLGRCS